MSQTAIQERNQAGMRVGGIIRRHNIAVAKITGPKSKCFMIWGSFSVDKYLDEWTVGPLPALQRRGVK